MAQFLDKWLAASVKPSVKTKTYEGYESIVRVRVAPRIGKRQLAKLSALDLQSLYTELADRVCRPAPSTTRTASCTARSCRRSAGTDRPQPV